MSAITSSASKIVFIMLTATACAAFLMKILEAKDFMVLAIAASSFYFSQKGDPNLPNAGK